jgi:hypothetical protein
MIKLKAGELALLRAIAHSPRSTRSLTHVDNTADVQLAPAALQSYLANLTEHGFIEPPERCDGGFRVTQDGLAHLAEIARALTPSTLICGASMPSGSLVLPKWPAASERVERNKLVLSRGMGA